MGWIVWNMRSARAGRRSWCWRWWPTRWWPNCSTTRRGSWCSADRVLLGYLLVSAVCSTVAFALFEVSTIFQLHDLMALDVSIKSEIGAEKLIKRGYFVLAVSVLINFLTVLYFLALAWHTGSAVRHQVPARRSAPALELALLRGACAGLYAVPVPGGHLRRAAQERERSDSGDPARLGAAGPGALEAAEGSADRADDARRRAARCRRCCAGLSPRRPSASPSWRRRPVARCRRSWRRG